MTEYISAKDISKLERLQQDLAIVKREFLENANNLDVVKAIEMGILSRDECVTLLERIAANESSKDYICTTSIGSMSTHRVFLQAPGDYDITVRTQNNHNQVVLRRLR